MDVDAEDDGPQDMERGTGEVSMTTDVPYPQAYSNHGDGAGTAEMFDIDEGCYGINGIDIATHDPTAECAGSNDDLVLPGNPILNASGPGTVVDYKTFSKLIVSPGCGFSVPKDGTMCNIDIAPLNSYSLPVERIGFEMGENLVMVVGEGDEDISIQLDLCIQTMKAGEMCDVQIPITTETLQSAGCDTTNTYSFKIRLISFQESVATWQLLTEDKLSRAVHHKERGTTLFQRGATVFAFRRFSKAAKYLICCQPADNIPEHLLGTYLKLKCQCYSNMAACQMKLGRLGDAVKNCTAALDVEPKNVKALYRRGQALLQLNDTESAQRDLLLVVAMEPQNKAAIGLLAQLEDKQRRADSKLAAGLSKMFS